MNQKLNQVLNRLRLEHKIGPLDCIEISEAAEVNKPDYLARFFISLTDLDAKYRVYAMSFSTLCYPHRHGDVIFCTKAPDPITSIVRISALNPFSKVHDVGLAQIATPSVASLEKAANLLSENGWLCRQVAGGALDIPNDLDAELVTLGAGLFEQ